MQTAQEPILQRIALPFADTVTHRQAPLGTVQDNQ